MKVISFEKIVDLNIDPLLCYEWVEDALKNKKESLLPAKINLKPSDGVFYNTMPIIMEQWAGLKEVTRYPGRKPSLDSEILLYDSKTGENLAILDGNWITAMRTGAVAAHSIKLLAVQDFSTLGFIGLGNTARTTLLILLALFPNRKFTIKLKEYKDQHISFAERFKEYNNIDFQYCSSYEEVIELSDVVVSAATYFDGDICSTDCFKEGVLLVPIHTSGFKDCDLCFDRIFVDDTNHVKHFKYFNKWKGFAEVADVVAGEKEGRTNDKERIIAYNIGIALHDIYFAGKIYEMCKDDCPEIDLEAPKDKFWV